MCHTITLDVCDRVRIENGWVIGKKEIVVSEDGSYVAPVIGQVYSYIQLKSGILIHDKSFKPQEIMVVCAVTKRMKNVFYGTCSAGLHAFFSWTDAPKGWSVAARAEWLCFASDNSFSAHTLLCARNKTQLKETIEEYEAKKRKIWSFSWHFSLDKSQVKSPVFGMHDFYQGAVSAAYQSLEKHRPLHPSEYDLVAEALKKAWQSRTTKKLVREAEKRGTTIYAEVRSPLWM